MGRLALASHGNRRQSRTRSIGCLTRMPDKIKESNRIPHKSWIPFHCACLNGTMTNDELFKSALVERHRNKGVSFERETARSTTKSEDKIVVHGKPGATRQSKPKVTPSIPASRRATLMIVNGGFKIFK